MAAPLACYAFSLPKPILILVQLMNKISFAVSLLLIFLGFLPPTPPPPLPRPRSGHHLPDATNLSSPSPPSIKSLLPVVEFARLAGGSSPEVCVVCLAGFTAADEVRQLGNCRHAFHKPCIDRWIDADGFTCPLCRSSLLPPPPPPPEEIGKGVFVRLLTRIRRRASLVS
ncbi:hypothetical protein HPP92_004672 [Vanilla planifolia]|uniref:RING-type domain-containing protein n=1 Tax=Vanilla planifolia TaxID=51239 RepID=A0A835RN90_VANPL|nr:hypothetical protein HPP92_004672 [Vanilla planifolia]